MVNHVYHNGIIRAKSDAPIVMPEYLTLTREDTEKITTTEYRIGLKIKTEKSGGYYYAWYSAEPLTVTVDNAPLFKRLEEQNEATQLAVAELAETILGGDING